MKHTLGTAALQELHTLAPIVVRTYLDQSIPYNANFAEHPDEYRHHKPQWHQWGILSHTGKFLQAFREDYEPKLTDWGLWEQVSNILQESIDGRTKKELFEAGIAFHDIGKFAVRHLSAKQVSENPKYPDFSFGTHEDISEQLILSPLLDPFCIEHTVTEKQRVYIGRLAALHYELAKARDVGKRKGIKYTIEFINAEEHKEALRTIAASFPTYKWEVGLMYLGDSLAKTGLRWVQGNKPSVEEITRYLAEHNLDPRHAVQIEQTPVAMEATRAYLELLK